MSKLSEILAHTDFEHISLEDLVHLEDSLAQYENTAEKETLEALKKKISDKYMSFSETEYKGFLRDEIHEIRTGYGEENWGKYPSSMSPEERAKQYARNSNGWDSNEGWKFHLDVVPNRKHPVTKAVSEFLLDLGVRHKVADGGLNGKGMTVYCGSYDDITQLAHEIQKRFGKDIYEPPAYAKQVKQEHAFQPTVYGRFVPGRELGDYPRYGLGVSPIHLKAHNLLQSEMDYTGFSEPDDFFQKTLAKAVELGLTKNDDDHVFSPGTADFVFGDGRKLTEEDKAEIVLRHYCSHKLYAEALGSYYYGSNLDEFEKNFFKDMLPAKGTDKREKWDEVAKTFVEEAKTLSFRNRDRDNISRNIFDHIKNFSNGYIPIDFSRLPPERTENKDKTAAQGNQIKKIDQLSLAEQARQISEKISQRPQPKPEKENVTPPPQKKITAEEHISAPTPEENATAPKNQDFKEPWREFYQKVAAKEKSEYSEDKDSAHYKATLSRTNGEKLMITATPQHKVSLGVKDKDGKNKVPSYEDFNNLVLAAKEQGREISFGNIKTPEFKARLLLACLENGTEIKELPELSSLKGLEEETRQRLVKHKISLCKRMLNDKEKTGLLSGLDSKEKEQRKKIEQARQTVREGKKSGQTDTEEFNAAQNMLFERRKALIGRS